jgi:hypothetical protein
MSRRQHPKFQSRFDKPDKDLIQFQRRLLELSIVGAGFDLAIGHSEVYSELIRLGLRLEYDKT